MKKITLLFISFILFSELSLHARPRVVILSAPYGAGHDKSAEAIEILLKRMHPEVEIVRKNAQDFMSTFFKRVSTSFFEKTQTHLPRVYTRAFENYVRKGAQKKTVGDMSMTLSMSSEEALEYFDEVRPDVILSVWPHATELIVRLREYGFLSDIPFGTVLTDHVSKSSRSPKFQKKYDDSGRDYFTELARAADIAFLPNRFMQKDYIDAGISPEKLVVTGLPMVLEERADLTVEQVLQNRKSAREKLGLDPARRTFMIESGKNGVGNYPLMLVSLMMSFSGETLNLIAACGENKKQFELMNQFINGAKGDSKLRARLLRRLKPFIKSHPESEKEILEMIENGIPASRADIKVLGFTPLGEWRKASNAVITKAGGKSTTEMGADGFFMILNEQLASGQEIYNVNAFEGEGLASVAHSPVDVGSLAKKWEEDQNALQDYIPRSNTFRKSLRTDLISDWIASAPIRPDRAANIAPESRRKFESSCRRAFQGLLRQLSRESQKP